MQIVFWQNIVSSIQVPFLRELTKYGSVTLVVPERLSKERLAMGWQIPDMGNINLIIDPSDIEMAEIFKLNEIHFFSGVTGYLFVKKAFKASLNYNVQRGLIVERPLFFNHTKLLFIIKTLLFDYRYFKKIDYVFAMGKEAVDWYQTWNKKWSVYEFAYVVEEPKYIEAENGLTKMVFSGSLIDRKDVAVAINAIGNTDIVLQFDIIGNGPQLSRLKELVLKNESLEKVNFLGGKSQKYILENITNYDILILPSKHDGWGAVVNEALMAGVYVICSDKCGAERLIHNDIRLGRVFKATNLTDLIRVLNITCSEMEAIRANKEYRRDWATCISGTSVANYFMKCLKASPVDKIKAPWAKKIIMKTSQAVSGQK